MTTKRGKAAAGKKSTTAAKTPRTKVPLKQVVVEPLPLDPAWFAYFGNADKRRPDRVARYIETVASATGFQLLPHATDRQFRTAAELLRRLTPDDAGAPGQFGQLLADDVGLGKTYVAALLALAVAAGQGGRAGRVYVLAPNESVRDKWRKDLASHLDYLRLCHPATPSLEGVKVLTSMPGRGLRPGQVAVNTLGAADRTGFPECELLIVDEAHRASGELSAAGRFLTRKRNQCRFKRALFLTATPFSIGPRRLINLLKFLGMAEGDATLRAFANYVQRIHDGRLPAGHTPEAIADHLADLRRRVIDVLRRWVVRNEPDDRDRREMGTARLLHQPIDCRPEYVETLIRAERFFRLTGRRHRKKSGRANDPRYHVGCKQLRLDLLPAVPGDDPELPARGRGNSRRGQSPATESSALRQSQHAEAERHRAHLRKRLVDGRHPKMDHVARHLTEWFREHREKALVFCHHHATARELAERLHGDWSEAGDCRAASDPVVDPGAFLAALRPRLEEKLAAGPGGQVISGDGPAPLSGRMRDHFLAWLSDGKLLARAAARLDPDAAPADPSRPMSPWSRRPWICSINFGKTTRRAAPSPACRWRPDVFRCRRCCPGTAW